MAGGVVDSTVHFLEGTDIELSINWAELKEDHPEIKKYKHHCDREWSLVIHCTDKKKGLASLLAKFGIPIASFVNVFLPGGGTVASKVLHMLGVDVTVGVDLTFLIYAEIGGQIRAGETKPTITFTIGAILDAYLNAKAQVSTSLELSIGVTAHFEPAITARFPTRDLFACTLAFEPGDIKFGVRGVYKIDTFWYKTSNTIDYYPESLRVTFGSFETKPVAAIK